MSVSKYRVRSTCLSCDCRISATVVAVVAKVEDHDQPKAYLVHDSCQSNMLRDLPFDDEPEPETGRR